MKNVPCGLLMIILVMSSLNSQEKRHNLKNYKRPNIVFILVDDLGYSDVGYMGYQKNINTPNIDKLAKTGMVFTQAYAAAPVCSPTRASILTGKSPASLKLTCHIPGLPMESYLERQHRGKTIKEPFFRDHLPIEELTIADALKENGYTTGFFGKWHLAGAGSARANTNGIINEQFHPEYQGFDLNIGGCAYGQPSKWFAPYKNATIPNKEEDGYLTDRMGDEAVSFIKTNANKPFFLYLSTYTVHTPLVAPQELVDRNNGNVYFAMIEKLDQNVGKVMEQLEESDLLENTLVIFYSDNGGLWDNHPLRSKKGSLHEGGIRVPLIMNWPTKIHAGKSNVPVTSVDMFPTILDVTGAFSNAKELEGISLWPMLRNKGELENRALYWHFPHFRNGGIQDMGAAIREGDWKLIWDFETGSTHLYNLREDTMEATDLVLTNPEKKDELLAKLKNWQEKVGAEMPK